MVVQSLAFYLFATLIVFSATVVIVARNPVYSVLFLILAFFNTAFLFVLLGAEFLAMILIIVYVGAVAVLFLFVVMMLDINFAELHAGFACYMPIGAAVGTVLAAELIVIGGGMYLAPEMVGKGAYPMPSPDLMSNAHALGRVLYTEYIYLFQIAGLILLVAMIGAIVLTYRRRPDIRQHRQRIATQLSRRAEDTVKVVKVPTRGGV